MKYSINPFKWLAWLWRREECRRKGWRLSYARKPVKKAVAAKEEAAETALIKKMVKAHGRRREARRKVFPHFEKVSDRLEDYYEESEE